MPRLSQARLIRSAVARDKLCNSKSTNISRPDELLCNTSPVRKSSYFSRTEFLMTISLFQPFMHK